MPIQLPKVKPDDEILAEHFEGIYRALEKLQISIGQNGSITMDDSGSGIALGMNAREGFWIKLTSNSGAAYAWTEQLAQPSGTWVDGYQSGTTATDPAREINGNASPTSLPLIVWAWRAPQSAEVVFQLGSC
jgi:hypothetical protein